MLCHLGAGGSRSEIASMASAPPQSARREDPDRAPEGHGRRRQGLGLHRQTMRLNSMTMRLNSSTMRLDSTTMLRRRTTLRARGGWRCRAAGWFASRTAGHDSRRAEAIFSLIMGCDFESMPWELGWVALRGRWTSVGRERGDHPEGVGTGVRVGRSGLARREHGSNLWAPTIARGAGVPNGDRGEPLAWALGPFAR